MMNSRNIAYTAEYQKQRAEWDYLFQDEYLSNNIANSPVFAEGRYKVTFKNYFDPNGTPYAKYGVLMTVYNEQGEKLFEQKNCHYKRFCSYVKHENGNEYLLFAIDLYGYSCLNLTTLDVYHYMPEEVLAGGETFIWTNVVYSGTDKIAVEGCYWACDHEFEIYDFSEPEELPYKQLVKHEDLEPEYDNWLNPSGWATSDEFSYEETCGATGEKVTKSVKF